MGSRNMYYKILEMEHPESQYQLLCACHNQIKKVENCEDPTSGKSPRIAECHPNRPHHSKGLCDQCYQAKWYLDKKERLQRAN
jgi:hypothetical protein